MDRSKIQPTPGRIHAVRFGRKTPKPRKHPPLTVEQTCSTVEHYMVLVKYQGPFGLIGKVERLKRAGVRLRLCQRQFTDEFTSLKLSQAGLNVSPLAGCLLQPEEKNCYRELLPCAILPFGPLLPRLTCHPIIRC